MNVRRHARVACAVGACAVVVAGSGCGGSAGAGAPAPSARRPARPARHAGEAVHQVPALRLPPSPSPRTVRVPILTYHRVHRYATETTKSIPDLTVEPANFAAQMAAIDRAGYTTLSQLRLYQALFRGRALPRRPVLITADDGYVDDVREMLPVLRRRHMVATFYIITSRFGEPGFVDRAQVRRLAAAGMDIGAHTRTHATLPALSSAQVRAEVAGSAADLRRVLRQPVPWFAYPYGAFDAAVVEAVRQAGFVLAVTTQGGERESSRSSLTMPRIHIGRASTAASVLACLRAGCGGAGPTPAGR